MFVQNLPYVYEVPRNGVSGLILTTRGAPKSKYAGVLIFCLHRKAAAGIRTCVLELIIALHAAIIGRPITRRLYNNHLSML